MLAHFPFEYNLRLNIIEGMPFVKQFIEENIA